MNLTPEQKQLGKDNFHDSVGTLRSSDKAFQEAVAVSRRSFLKGTAAVIPGLGAAYFGYHQLTKQDRVKVGFIGTGDEGGILIAEHPEDYMDIVAIADIRPSNRKRAFTGDGNDARPGLNGKLGKEAAGNIKAYTTYKEMLKAHSEIQAVVIAVPLSQHAAIAKDCLNAGKHVLTEKLMAYSIKECKELIQLAKQKELLLAVGHQRHYSALYDNANFLVKQGILGDVKFIRAQWHRNNSWPDRDSWRKRIPQEDIDALKDSVTDYGYDSVEQLCNWRLYRKTGGGLMAELGSHQLDACSIFLDKVKPIAVQGYGGKNFYGVKGIGSKDKQEDPREVDDHVYATIEFPGPHYAEDNNDIVIVTYSSINTNALEPYGETVFGSRGTMMVHDEKEALLFKENQPGGSPGGIEQRLAMIQGSGGGPVMSASESLAPSTQAATSASAMGEKISRGYREEMEHFCYCVHNHPDYLDKSPAEGGLRCNGRVAMADAIMALTTNLAMKHHKRVTFKKEWFDPTNLTALPETDPDIIG